MAAILGELPKNYSDTAKTIIQQHLRRNTSGTNSPSSPMSCSSPKMILSPQLGPMSLNHYASKLIIRFTSQRNVQKIHFERSAIIYNHERTNHENQTLQKKLLFFVSIYVKTIPSFSRD